MRSNDDARLWIAGVARGVSLDLPRIMGILNVTPDSFSDGGAYASVDEAAAAGMRMIEEGALIIDVGGESTRPGSESVGDDEQIRRTVPLIAALRSRNAVCWISIDTTRAAVAHAALEAGADIINDETAGLDDEEMLPLAAKRGCGLILMHRPRQPRDDVFSTQHAGNEPHYASSVSDAVRQHLQERVVAALEAGVHRGAIVIDPGLGFGKSVAQNYELASRMGELQRALDLPVLSAASRKSFLTRPPGNADCGQIVSPPRERLGPSIAMTLSHWQQGIRLFRVHDVAAHAQAIAVAGALLKEQNLSVTG